MQDREAGALQPVHNIKPYKRVQGIHQIEHFFRVAAGLEIDKEEIKRYYEFIDQKMKDLLLIAVQTAKAHDHITIELRDVPTTKGLQESIQLMSRAYCKRAFPSHRLIGLTATKRKLVCLRLPV